jgi:uncharacterized repeat protein (TIGR01451 family)
MGREFASRVARRHAWRLYQVATALVSAMGLFILTTTVWSPASASAATHFDVAVPATTIAGSAFSITVTALDVSNATDTGYTGTVHFTSSDGQATLPADSTLTNGVGTFSVTLKTAGSQTITATDTVDSSITGTSGAIVVTTAPVTHLAVSAPATATAGSTFLFTVTAQDQFDNTDTGFSATVHFTSSDAGAGTTLPADSIMAGGVGTFMATLVTAGPQTITASASGGAISGTTNVIVVSPTAATHFVVSAPATATAGTAFSFTVTALDQFDNTATGYAGTVHFTATDGQATLPADATLTNGVGTFSATLKTAGTQTITATDTVTFSITGTSNSIFVNPAPATHFEVSAPPTATSGVPFVFSIVAMDQFNNTDTGYTGTVHFTSSDAGAGTTLPADSTLTSGNGSFSATLVTGGTQTITATDTVNSSITGSSNAITVSGNADLALTKIVDNPTPNVGDSITFTVSVSNGGPLTATNVTVTDVLPVGLTFVSATPSQGSYNSTTGTWTVGTLPVGPSQTLHITAVVATPTPATNTATVTHSDQFDPNLTNNSASATITPQRADLGLTKTVNNPTPNVGDTVTFMLTLSNAGPDAATNVTVNDLLPAGVALVSATPSQGSYASVTGVWTIGTVAAGNSATLQIQATVNSSSTVTNTAVISHADQFDPNTANNAASATLNGVVTATTTTLTASPNPAVSGQPVTLTATVLPVPHGIGHPLGTVEYFDGSTLLGTAALHSPAVFTTSALGAGTHQLTATYTGSAGFTASTSAVLVVTVAAAPASTTTSTSTVPTTTTPTTQPSTGTLPHTGGNSDRTGAYAMLALMVGVALTTCARRRRNAS